MLFGALLVVAGATVTLVETFMVDPWQLAFAVGVLVMLSGLLIVADWVEGKRDWRE